MDNLFERFGEFKMAIVKLFRKRKVRRWTVEILVSLIVGISAGCITYAVLNHEDKSLTVSAEKAKAVEEQEASSTDETAEEADATEAAEEDYSGVTITVVDQGEYAAGIKEWSQEEIEAAISERSSYLSGNKYWDVISTYWQEARSVTDSSCYCKYLFDTANTVYTKEDFDGLPAEVIHVAKNEIYARHGYSFRDTEMMNYFMGQVWYTPSVMPADFSEEVFTETEVKNLDMLNSIDSM